MPDTIRVKRTNESIVHDIKEINRILNAGKDGILYVKRGQLDTDTYEALFTIKELH